MTGNRALRHAWRHTTAALGDPLGPGGPYIRKAQHLQQGVPLVSHGSGDSDEREGERRQDQVGGDVERRRGQGASSGSTDSVMPPAGSQRSLIPTSQASTRPSQKEGVA